VSFIRPETPSFWRKNTVPNKRARRIEEHPLAFNEGWIPGGQKGFAPLVGPGGALNPIGGVIANSPIGPGFRVNAFNQYATGPSVGPALQPSAGMSLVWAGVALGADDLNFSTIFGAYYSAAEPAPYYNCVLKRNGALAFESNVAGTRYTITTTTDLATGIPSVVVLTANFISGVQNIYLNGILIGTQTVPAGSPSYAGPPVFSFSDPVFHTDRYPNTVSAAGYVYNFALSAEAIQGVTTEPFGMLDEEDETPRIWFPVSGGTTLLLAQASWGWNKQAAVAKFNNALAAKAWTWNGQAPGVNQETHLTLAAKAWAWVPQAPVVQRSIALVSEAWGWTVQAPGVSHLAALASKAWASVGRPFVVGQPTVIRLAQATWGWMARPLPGFSRGVGLVRGIVRGLVRGIIK